MKKCPRCDREFDGELRFCPVDGTALRFANTVEIVPGAIIGQQYEIRKKLGDGGMGVVYLANDIRLDRLCALKVLREDALADSDAVARFHREATQASRIQHPNTVAIYNFDETEDRLTYLAMEYVAGETLAALLGRVGALSPRAAGRIVWQIANALGAAHELRIVHRDLKPGNIMITRYREWDDFVKVVDFGIAKAFGTTAARGITTKSGRIGTPEYMSPEQWLTPDVDHRSDIFSLGLIAVHILAGGFPVSDRIAPTLPGRILIDAIPQDDWPEALKDVLSRCIAERPEDRFQRASDFAAALVGVISDWVPPVPGVREPWEARIGPTTSSAATRLWTPDEERDVRVATGAESGRPRRFTGRARILIWALAIPAVFLAIWSFDRFGSPGPVDLQTTGSDSSSAPPGSAVDTTPGDPPDPRLAAAESVRTPAGSTSRLLQSPGPGQGEAVDPTSAPRFLIDRLEALLADPADPDAGPDPDSVGYAIALAAGLLDRDLGDSMRIEVTVHLAEAEFLTRADSAACDRLRRIRPVTQTRGFFQAPVEALLRLNCAPQG